jgi:ribosomal protein L9
MASRPITPSRDAHPTHLNDDISIPGRPPASSSKRNSYISSGVPGSAVNHDHAQGAPVESSLLAQSGSYENEDLEKDYSHTSAVMDHGAVPELRRSASQMSQSQIQTPSRGGTLKKKSSLKRTSSLMRTSSRRSSRAGSVRSMTLGEKEKYGQSEEVNSVFYCPVPTSGSPTELLANRFQGMLLRFPPACLFALADLELNANYFTAWRKVLKDLITYFRDVQKSRDGRAKAIQSASNVINNMNMPAGFLTSGGLGDAIHILTDYNRQLLAEGNKAKEIETEIIAQLTGLRSDLQQKIKEIKSLSGDFKSSVDKEQEATKRAVRAFQEALGSVDHDSSASSGKGDPFIVKMGVDRQVERQIDEENYLHRVSSLRLVLACKRANTRRLI